jgi:hypothetical protein
MTETMSGTVFVGGGFGGATRDGMSEALSRRCAMADHAFDRQSAVEERARTELAAIDEETRIRLSIEQAIDRGEVFDVRSAYRNGGIGRTRAETVAYASSRMDWEDARQAGMQAKWVQDKCNAEWYGDTSADTSAPSPAEVAEQETMAARAEKYRAKRRDRSETIKHARRLAAMDRGAR